MSNKTFILTERDRNRVLFRFLAKMTNVKYTTPYFQILSDQPVEYIEKITVSNKEFDKICSGNRRKKRNVLYISRDENGKLIRTCFIDKLGNSFISGISEKSEKVNEKIVIDNLVNILKSSFENSTGTTDNS